MLQQARRYRVIAKSTVMALGAALVTLNPWRAQGDSPLLSAFVSACENSGKVTEQYYKYREAEEHIRRARTRYRPTFSLDADIGPRYRAQRYEIDVLDDLLGAAGTARQSTLSTSIRVPLYRGGSSAAALQAARATAAAEYFRIEAIAKGAILEAAKTYFAVVRDTALAELQREHHSILQREFDLVDRWLAIGEVTRADAERTRARFYQAAANFRRAVANLETSRQQYELIVGRSPDNLATGSVAFALPATVDEALRLAEAHSPEIRAARWDVVSAASRVREAQGALLPKVDLALSAAHYENPYLAESRLSRPPDKLEDASALIQLSIPIFQGGAAISDVRAAKQGHAGALERQRIASELAISEARSAWTSLLGARFSIEQLEAAVTHSEAALIAVAAEEIVGESSPTDVLSVRRELVDSRTELEKAKYDVRVAEVYLALTVGRLLEEIVSKRTGSERTIAR
jgi:outer membrane protein